MRLSPCSQLRFRRGELSNPWVLGTITLVILGGLIALLWRPWEQTGPDRNRKLVFYCAAGMAKPVRKIAEEYKDKYGVEVQVSFAGTGKLLSTMIANKGKGDLYLAADVYHMNKAKTKNFVAETIPIAQLKPVLVVKKSTQEKLTKPVRGVDDLLRDDLKVVMANPELAAIGKLGKDVLRKARPKLWEELEKQLKSAGSNRVSTVGTVNEVTQAVRTQEGVLGIVWEAVAKQSPALTIINAKEFDTARELIQIGVLTDAKDAQATAALQFARYLTARDKGLKHFAQYHFHIVEDADAWAVRPKLHLAAGAMLKPGIDDIVKDFAKREGVEIHTSYNGCGILVSQMKSIKESGPGQGSNHFPDAYFSCDVSYMTMVQDWFDAGALVSKNKMVLIVRKGNPKNIRLLNDLTKGNLKIGLGHPKNSALGKLTDDLLKKLKLHEKLYSNDFKGRVVHKDAGHALVNDVRVGAMDVAVVYKSNAKANPENVQKYIDIVPIDIAEAFATQPFAIAKDSPHKYLMRRLLYHIVTDQSRRRFETLGFEWKYRGE